MWILCLFRFRSGLDWEKQLFSNVFNGKIWKKSQKGVYLHCQKSQKGV